MSHLPPDLIADDETSSDEVRDLLLAVVRREARVSRDSARTDRGSMPVIEYGIDATLRIDVTAAPDFDATMRAEVEIERGVGGVEVSLALVGRERVNGRLIDTYVVEQI